LDLYLFRIERPHWDPNATVAVKTRMAVPGHVFAFAKVRIAFIEAYARRVPMLVLRDLELEHVS